MRYTIMIDFGSTFTKVVCVDMQEKKVVLSDRFPSTVRSDAQICLQNCFDAVEKKIGKKELLEAKKLSSSSAAGGLRMAVIGLSKTLSYNAAKNTAFGAGGKITQDYYGLLTETGADELAKSDTEIVLLCGGYENGNKTALLHNAKMIAGSALMVPVIYAGNSAVAQDVRSILKQGGKECFLVPNIIPAVGQLDTVGAENLIRQLFMKRITNMKGLDRIQTELGEILMPTPAAVLAAGKLLSRGTAKQQGLGPIMMVDIGGATTDVYSFCENRNYCGAKLVGAVEPSKKRTVEGDMGMRESSVCLLREVGVEKLAEMADVPETVMEKAIGVRTHQTYYLPQTEQERNIDDALAQNAIAVSVRRHAGHIERVVTGGNLQNQVGKNLTEIKTVIGTGGVIVNHENPKKLMQMICLQKGESEDLLIPRTISTLVDKDYVLFAAGLLSNINEEIALTILKDSIT